MPDPAAQRRGGGYRHRADLAEVLPQHVQRTAPDDDAVELGDQELLHRLVEGDDLLGQQDPTRIAVHKGLDRRHVGGPGPPDEHVCHDGSE